MRLLLALEWNGRDDPYRPTVYAREQFDQKFNDDYHFSLEHPEYLDVENGEQSSDYIHIELRDKEEWSKENEQLMESRDEFHPCAMVDIEDDDEWIVFFDLDCAFEPKAIVIKDVDIDSWMLKNVFDVSKLTRVSGQLDWSGNTVYSTKITKTTVEHMFKDEYCSEYWECKDFELHGRSVVRNEPVLHDLDGERNPKAGDGIWRMKVKDWMKQ